MYLILGFFIALLNVIVYAGIYRLFLTKRLKRRWTSNISGNPYALDRLLTAFFGPFPELNDFNLVLGNFPLDNIIILHGYPPLSRYWSFQSFLFDLERNSVSTTLADIETILDGDTEPLKLKSDWGVQKHSKPFTIVLSDSEHKPSWAKNFIDIGRLSGLRKTHLTFRAFCPEHGIAFEAPKLYTLQPEQYNAYSSFEQFVNSPGVKPYPLDNEERIHGPWSTVSNPNSERNRLFQTVVLNLVLMIVLSGLGVVETASDLMLLFSVSTFFSWLLYAKIGFGLADRRYRKMFGDYFGEPNKKASLPDPHSTTANNPNHMYFSIPYDVTNCDLLVTGWRKGPFRYTSVHCYYWNSLPIRQFLFDQSLIPDPKEESEQDPLLQEGEEKFTVRITTSPNYDGEENVINVSDCPAGLCMVRLVYPHNQEAVVRCTPKVKQILKGQKIDRKQKTQ